MSIRLAVRSAALKIPPLRRYYDFASGLALRHEALQREHTSHSDSFQAEKAELRAALDQAYAALEVERDLVSKLTDQRDDAREAAEAAEAERAKAKATLDEHDSLKLQVYVLTSDFQRSVAQVDKLRTEAQAGERRLEQLRTELAAAQAAQAQAERAQAQAQAQAEGRCAELVSETQRRQAETEAHSRREAELTAQADDQLRRIKELETQLGGSLALRTDLEQSHARLLGRTSLISADLVDLRRALRGTALGNASQGADLRRTYLDLLEAALTGRIYGDVSIAPWAQGYDPEVRAIGRDWPSLAQTMIGTVRMRNIRTLAERLIEDGIAGDFLEAGVWRGGACIYMRGILAAYADVERRVLVADSFAGLPEPVPEIYPADLNDAHHTVKELAVSLEDVKGNFARYGLLDNQVIFLQGWFKDTLPTAPTQKLALLRLDGDMYSSTTEALDALYAKVAVGGFVIIDDYILPACRQATDDFRSRYRILDEIQEIDGAGVFWRKTV